MTENSDTSTESSDTSETMRLKPIIALVGRPNVGKSTLFNRLTRTRDALVANLPGLTRDRKYGEGKLGGWSYIVVDTGGLSGEPESIDQKMAEQTRQAYVEADIVLFMVDGRSGLTPSDEVIANDLRRLEKPIYLIVNKIDKIGEVIAQSDFYKLGLGEPFAVAAAHGRGVRSMIEKLGETISADQTTETYNSNPDNGAIRIAFIGRPNVGKSTLINRILGEDRVVAYDQPGTTRDSISIPFERSNKKYILIDTAGVRRRGKVKHTVEKFSVIKALQAIDAANVAILVIDAQDNITEQDLHLLTYAIEAGRALVIAINKWDGLSDEQRQSVKAGISRRLKFLNFAKIHFISALHGSGVGTLYQSINQAYDSAMRDIATPELTRMLEYAVETHQPPLVNGRRIELRYAHQGGRNPPVIVIHGNQTNKIPESYRKYLINFMIDALKLKGTPVRIEFKSSVNPFKGRKPKPKLEPGSDRKVNRRRRSIKKH